MHITDPHTPPGQSCIIVGSLLCLYFCYQLSWSWPSVWLTFVQLGTALKKHTTNQHINYYKVYIPERALLSEWQSVCCKCSLAVSVQFCATLLGQIMQAGGEGEGFVTFFFSRWGTDVFYYDCGCNYCTIQNNSFVFPSWADWAIAVVLFVQELDIIYRIPHCVPISAHHKWNFDDLLEKMWNYLRLVRMWVISLM